MLGKLLEQGSVAEQRREIAIDKEEFLLGRGIDCDLRLSGAAISRHHCLIRFRGGEATLTDLGSANGTFVNGQRVRSQVTLNHGDDLGVGDFHFIFTLSAGSGLQWGAEKGLDPLAATCRIKDVKRGLREPEGKEEGHPPGEAGGRGEGSG
jgi:pSer/pThr/pTyr-binding forkhead associated (FHA) protein